MAESLIDMNTETLLTVHAKVYFVLSFVNGAMDQAVIRSFLQRITHGENGPHKEPDFFISTATYYNYSHVKLCTCFFEGSEI